MADIIIEKNQYIKQVVSNYMTPQLLNDTIQIASFKETIIPYDDTPTNNPRYALNPGRYEGTKAITVIAPNSAVTTIVADDNNQSGTYVANMEGVYRIRYQGAVVRIAANGTGTTSPFDISFYILAARNYDALPRLTIASVIDRVLDLEEPHLASVAPKFKLDPAQREMFAKIEAPEFAFTKKTLKEILDAIGGFIHGIPRLVRGESGELDTIHYDMLGGTSRARLSDPKFSYVTEIRSHNIENYATELDSSVDNFVNTLDPSEGSVIDPCGELYRSTRCETIYARIEESNMVIATQYPIYSIQKLEFLYFPGGSVGGMDVPKEVADLTPYVFESAEYGRLSSFNGVYPNSKAHAIYYEKGQKNIKGLNFKSPTVIGGAGAKYSLANIITDALGIDITADAWGKEYATYEFQITYTPIFSARVLQSKVDAAGQSFKRALVYNQGANLVETRYYGENLKGVVARMGNPEFIRTYLIAIDSPHLIPKPGDMWDDDYYVASTTNEMYGNHIVCTVGMSKDFNRLSQYVGINSEWRAYEISEKSAYNRDFVYHDYIVIGGKANDTVNLLGSEGVKNAIYGALCDTTNHVSAAVVTGYSEGQAQSTVTLPVISTAFGNSVVFSYMMQDNYSAGDSAQYDENGNVSGYWQTGVQYPDYYGRLDTLEFALKKPFELKQQPGGDGAEYRKIGRDLPRFNVDGTTYVKTPDSDPIKIDKDSREILRMHYEISYVLAPEWRDLIIGPAMARKCPLISNKQSEKGKYETAGLYFLERRIGKFQTHLDASEMLNVYGYYGSIYDGTPDRDMIRTENGVVKLVNAIPAQDYAGWAIANRKTGEIFLARNVPIKKQETVEMPYICVKHDI